MGDAGVVIVGSGFSGLGMAMRLKQEGMHDFEVLERSDEVGGTWRDHTYPGAGCDVPSNLYSFSFALNPKWTTSHSSQPELFRYLRDCADRSGVRPHIRFGCEVHAARWDEETTEWRLDTSHGPRSSKVLIMAAGPITIPIVPALPGLERFAGTTFHSSAWNHDHDLGGERVAVIGTGSSSAQFVPEIQEKVKRLHVFQRTAPWVMPKLIRPITAPEHWLYKRLPGAQRIIRAGLYVRNEFLLVAMRYPAVMTFTGEAMARAYLHVVVRDRALRKKITPLYKLGCKRLVNADKYLPALTQPNVEVVTEPIVEVRERSIVTEDGREREVDTIIYGTGYNFTSMALASKVTGRDGVTLDKTFGSLRGTTVAGFPNMFILVGPNTGLSHTSLIYMIESQIKYVIGGLRAMRELRLAALAARPAAQAAYNESVQSAMSGTVWTTGGCRSHYMDEQGRNLALWPRFTFMFRAATRRFDPAEYDLQEVVN